MIISFSGHRFSYFSNPIEEEAKMVETVDAYLQQIKEEYSFIVGGAQGFDSVIAKYAISNEIPFELHVPFPLQIHSRYWSDEDKLFLLEQHKRATKVKVISEKFNTRAYQKRSESMVNSSHLLLTWYKIARSGTGNCVRYARKTGILIVHLRKWRLENLK